MNYNGSLLATLAYNSNASIIHIGENSDWAEAFGQIVSFYELKSTPACSRSGFEMSDVWISVRFFLPIPDDQVKWANIQIDSSNMSSHLYLNRASEPKLIHISQVAGSCAWKICQPHEISEALDVETVFMVTLEDFLVRTSSHFLYSDFVSQGSYAFLLHPSCLCLLPIS